MSELHSDEPFDSLDTGRASPDSGEEALGDSYGLGPTQPRISGKRKYPSRIHGTTAMRKDAYGPPTYANYQHRDQLHVVLHQCLLRRDYHNAAAACAVLLGSQSIPMIEAFKQCPSQMTGPSHARDANRIERFKDVLHCTLEVLKAAADSRNQVRLHGCSHIMRLCRNSCCSSTFAKGQLSSIHTSARRVTVSKTN